MKAKSENERWLRLSEGGFRNGGWLSALPELWVAPIALVRFVLSAFKTLISH